MVEHDSGGGLAGFIPWEPSKMARSIQCFFFFAAGRDNFRNGRFAEQSVTLWISEAFCQMRMNPEAVSHIADHQSFMHGPGIVADDKPLHSVAIGSDGAIVCREGMVAVHGFALRKERVLPLIPERILTLEMEHQIGLLADLFAAVVLH